jgi:DNA-binding response OmpR family regulator
VRAGDVSIDLVRRRLRILEVEAELTPAETTLLAALVSHAGRWLSVDELLDVLGARREIGAKDRLRQHVRTARRKMGEHRGMLEWCAGRGYRVNPLATGAAESAE